MNLPRFFVDPNRIHRDKFSIIDENIIKKVRKVLRLSKGSQIEIFDGENNLFVGEIEFMTREVIKGKILSETRNASAWAPKFKITLAQALPRAGKIDEILRMNTEVGISEFIMFESEYSQVKLQHIDSKKHERWEKIVIEASRQSERGTIPAIAPTVKFGDLLNIQTNLKLILHSRELEKVQNHSIEEIKSKIEPGGTILLIVGPEGGFSPNEVELATNAGFQFIHLDLPVLRTETAGIVINSFLLL